MKKEIDVALDLLVSYIQRFGSIKEESTQKFQSKLREYLYERYQGHWYPGMMIDFFCLSHSKFSFIFLDIPIKGQAFRSLEFNKENDYCDEHVSQVCNELGFASNLLGIRHDMTLWIDPFEVTIRLVLLRCWHSHATITKEFFLSLSLSVVLSIQQQQCVGCLRTN